MKTPSELCEDAVRCQSKTDPRRVWSPLWALLAPVCKSGSPSFALLVSRILTASSRRRRAVRNAAKPLPPNTPNQVDFAEARACARRRKVFDFAEARAPCVCTLEPPCKKGHISSSTTGSTLAWGRFYFDIKMQCFATIEIGTKIGSRNAIPQIRFRSCPKPTFKVLKTRWPIRDSILVPPPAAMRWACFSPALLQFRGTPVRNRWPPICKH